MTRAMLLTNIVEIAERSRDNACAIAGGVHRKPGSTDG